MQAEPAQFVQGSTDGIPQLLVADDSPMQRRALCGFLRQNGYEVSEAADGDSVLRHLKECSVDLLLLDLNMPGGDGFDVLRYLQEHRRSMPVDEIQNQMHRLREQELPLLLLKPVDPEQLLQMVELQLRGGIAGSQ
jgi:DNA-binding response OmpR family regulator